MSIALQCKKGQILRKYKILKRYFFNITYILGLAVLYVRCLVRCRYLKAIRLWVDLFICILFRLFLTPVYYKPLSALHWKKTFHNIWALRAQKILTLVESFMFPQILGNDFVPWTTRTIIYKRHGCVKICLGFSLCIYGIFSPITVQFYDRPGICQYQDKSFMCKENRRIFQMNVFECNLLLSDFNLIKAC